MVLPLGVEAAWDVVVDWERQSRWMVLTRVWGTENGGVGVGGGVAARTSVGGLGFTDDMVITHWDPPRECTVKHLGTVVRGTGTFAIRPASDDPAAGTLADGRDSASADRLAGTAADANAEASADRVAGAAGGGSAEASADRVAGTAGEGDAEASADRVAGTPTRDGAELGSRSVFTWAEDVVPPLGKVGVVVWPVVRPVFEGMMRVSLRRLVREVAG
ncbi:hypothetical protein ACWCOV_15240 [Kribbella sp. NPDC002412]